MSQLDLPFPGEVWKPVHLERFAPYYEVSNYGRVRSLDRDIPHPRGGVSRIKGRVLRPGLEYNGYLTVDLRADSRGKRVGLHVLVAFAFLGPPPGRHGTRLDDYQVNHKDGSKQNNIPSNLEWLTGRENIRHAAETGLYRRGEEIVVSKLTEEEVLEIRRLYATGNYTMKELGERFGTAKSNIRYIVRRLTWTHI